MPTRLVQTDKHGNNQTSNQSSILASHRNCVTFFSKKIVLDFSHERKIHNHPFYLFIF